MSCLVRLLPFSALLCLVTPILGAEPSASDDEESGTVLRHVVLFAFKEDVKEAEIQEVVDAFAALEEKIDVIVDLEHGTDVGVEGLSQGFTHGWVVTFADAKGRDVYLPHPEHQAFVKIAKPRIEKVLVFDYVTKK